MKQVPNPGSRTITSAHDHHSDRRLIGAQAAIDDRLHGPRGVQESRLFRCRRLITSRVPKPDQHRLDVSSWRKRRGFHSWKSTSPRRRKISQKNAQLKSRRFLNRFGAQIPCDDVGQLVVFTDARFRLLHDELVAAFALSLADMHLSSALRTRFSPRGRGRIHHRRLVRLLSLQLFHPLFVSLCLGTLRMHARRRIRNLATNGADFTRRSRVHRAGLFLIHGNLLGEFANGRA